LSSILDSLKKLEKEKSQQGYPPSYTRVDKKASISKRAIGTIGVICVFIGAIGFAAYYLSMQDKRHEPLLEDVTPAPKPKVILDEQKMSLASSDKIPLTSPSTSRNRKTTTTVRKSETIVSGEKTITKSRSSEDRNDTVEVKTEKGHKTELKKDQEEKKVLDKTLREPKPKLLTKETDKSDSMENVSKEVITENKKPLPMDRLEGVDFKIQAISWGEIPQERLVVINNQVLREGDGIKGYQISHINPDDIVLRRDDKAYQLDFGLKGGS